MGLLLILAHPDDESFMAGGTLAALAERGVRTALVCATRGEEGSAGTPPLVDRAALPARREAELHEAAALLGIGRVQLLDYRDRALADAPPEAVRLALVTAIRAERPQVVLTFDPNGLNRHPDHVAISRFALDAVTAAADARWHPEAGPAHRVRRVLWPSPVFPWDEWRPAALAHMPGVDVVCDVRPWAARKAAALRAHRTQHGSVERLWFAGDAAVLGTETFRVGWGEPAGEGADDVFAGL